MARVERTRTPLYAKLKNLIDKEDGTDVKVGWFEGSSYPPTKEGAEPVPVAYIVSIHEYGYLEGNIPARPVIGPTIETNEERWKRAMRYRAKRIAEGKMTLEQAFEQLGLMAQGDLQKTISEVVAPELQESTIKARARRKRQSVEEVSTKPLEDTGLLITTATYQVTRNDA